MKKILVFILALLNYSVALAEVRNKTVIEYFIQNDFIAFLISGGYYTLLVIVVLIIISVSVNFPALYDSAKSLASMLYGRIARNSSLFCAL